MLDEHRAHLLQIVVPERTHRHDVGEIREFIDLDELVDEFGAVQTVDLRHDGDKRHLPFEGTVIVLRGELGTQSAQDAPVTGPIS